MARRRWTNDWITALLIGAMAGCAEHPRAMAPPSPAPARLYVSNEGSGDISVLDPLDGRLVGSFPVGKRPRGLRLTPDGRLLYAAVSGSAVSPPGSTVAPPPPDRSADGVVELETETGRVLRTLPAGNDPENLALTPDGLRLVVSNEEDGQASVIDLVSGKRVGTLPTGAEPEGVGCRPDGKAVYVTSEDEGTVTVIDPVALKVLATFKAGQRPRSVVFTSDGRFAFVTAEQSRTVTWVDAQKHAVLGTLRIDGPQIKPMGIALTRDNRTLYVSTGRGGSVVAIDVERFQITATYPNVGQRPWGVAVTSDGHRLFTANGPSNDVSIVDLPSGSLLQRVPAGTHPWGLALFEP
jgi:YVTN family beta-propeller protein